jgi:hypothetical protein
MDFQLDVPSTKQTRAMFTKTDKKCRTQFPIVPAKNMTAHQSQGQTWPDCVIHIALGSSQVTHPTSTATTLLYTARTRSNLLKNCLFNHILLDTWLHLGRNKTHQALLKFEKELRKHAKLFAEIFSKHHLYDDAQDNTSAVLTPDQEAEWAEIQAMTEMPKYDPATQRQPPLDTCRHVTRPTELDAMYEKIVQLLKNLPPDQHQLIVDKLVIPKTFARQFTCLSNIQTNYRRRQIRASMWVMDLLLCALNNSVVRPHFKGNRGN